uniref:U31-theraphotoxin-Cg1b n=1 Tax=Chilobrachys guangxiensis TaxID=278060 RepID=TX32C_CHIGU|nr:RecName: Full=U31-theraphotoxin-Cg1b; Short=U31-TRTX-Cg1b; AltName: Full=Jingzhaotoxin-65; Short=JZTX-65; Flags: Precursor [Chilobrachys guangxiensis]ABY71734.1 cystine knot toxin [Chilobrachys guangxiensis]
MKLCVIIIASLMVASVSGRLRKIKGTELDKKMLLEKLGHGMDIRFEETPRECSKKAGEKCESNCDCCGYSTLCGYITEGKEVKYQCMSKTSNNEILNTIGLGMNAIENMFSFCFR